MQFCKSLRFETVLTIYNLIICTEIIRKHFLKESQSSTKTTTHSNYLLKNFFYDLAFGHISYHLIEILISNPIVSKLMSNILLYITRSFFGSARGKEFSNTSLACVYSIHSWRDLHF